MADLSASGMREERKVVTALFADMVGSTSLGERLDPEDFRDFVGEVVARMIHAVEELGGTIKDLAGDGVLALFGAPESHEDDPQRAVLAGLRMTRDVGSYVIEVAGELGVEGSAIRVGINTGLAVLGPVGAGMRVEYGATGDVLNTAARLQSAASPGTVLVGAATHRTIEPLFEWGAAEKLTVKGKLDPIVAYRAMRQREVPGRVRGFAGTSTRVIGREPELAAVQERVRALRGGEGGILLVAGEPGIGKTRLLEEMRSFARSVTWLEGRCASYGQAVPYGPFRDLLREWIGTAANASDADVRGAMSERIAGTLVASPDVGQYLELVVGLTPRPSSPVADLSPEARLRRTFDAVRASFEDLSASGPTVVAIEDLHWADPTSLQLCEHLFPLADRAPVLIVLTARPEPDHPSWRLFDVAARYPSRSTARLILEALPLGSDRALLHALIGEETLPQELEERILTNAEGNPFFLEELVRSLIDEGALAHDDDRWTFRHDVGIAVPPTVGKVILARIDRLPPGSRELVLAASVLGRRFGLPLLRAVVGRDDISAAIDELVGLALFELDRGPPAAEYRFKHALIQEAAYGTLLRKQRRELHMRAAEGLQALFSDSTEELATTLAHHFKAGGDVARALSNYRLAGDLARRSYAVEEAIASYTGALELVAASTQADDVELRLARGEVRMQTGDSTGARDDFEAARETARQLGNRAGEMRAENELGFLVAGVADYRDALPHLEAALAIAEELHDAAAKASILSRISIVWSNQLRFDRALDFAERSLEAARRVGADLVLAKAMDCLKQVAMQTGDWATLEKAATELEQIHRRRGDLWYLQFVVFERAIIHVARAEWDTAARGVREALELNRRIGDRGNEPLYLGALGWIDFNRGWYQQAVTVAGQGVELAEEIRHGEWISWTRGHLGRTFLDLGCTEDARRHLERALEAADVAGAEQMALRAAAHLSRARLEQGDPKGAATLVERVQHILSAIRTPDGRTYVFGTDSILAAASTVMDLGRFDEAEALVTPVVDATRNTDWEETRAFGSLLLARLWAERGETDPTLALAEVALGAAARGRFPAAEWQAHAFLAKVLGRLGRGSDARRHRDAANVIIHALARPLENEGIRARFRKRASALLGE